MKFETENLHERRPSRVNLTHNFTKDELPPQRIGDEYFQERYRLTTTLGVDFYSNGAQLDRKKADAMDMIHAHMFKDMLPLVQEMILEAESDEMRETACRLKDMMIKGWRYE